MSLNIKIEDFKETLKKTRDETKGKNIFYKAFKFGVNFLKVEESNPKIDNSSNPISIIVNKPSTNFPQFTQRDKDFLKLINLLNQVYTKTEQYL
jgi:hypothetical protein